MTRKQTYTPPPSANLSVEQMRSALLRLEKRLDDLGAFDPTNITKRQDPRIQALENKIDDFLVRTFGEGTAEYKRYSSATRLDTAGMYVGRTVPIHEVIQGLQHGKECSVEILEGIKRTFEEEIDLVTPTTTAEVTQCVQSSAALRKVFIVHGSDHGGRDTVARFLGKLDLDPIILGEEANKGRTIHQKLRDNSTVAFAIVLFTPDDEGGPADKSRPLQPRARQNVVYELGFFSAILGDSKVCVLYTDGVEIPSDLSGVLYVLLDRHGAWKLNLAKEISAAGIQIDMNLVLRNDT